jgi:hypothetical protein
VRAYLCRFPVTLELLLERDRVRAVHGVGVEVVAARHVLREHVLVVGDGVVYREALMAAGIGLTFGIEINFEIVVAGADRVHYHPRDDPAPGSDQERSQSPVAESELEPERVVSHIGIGAALRVGAELGLVPGEAGLLPGATVGEPEVEEPVWLLEPLAPAVPVDAAETMPPAGTPGAVAWAAPLSFLSPARRNTSPTTRPMTRTALTAEMTAAFRLIPFDPFISLPQCSCASVVIHGYRRQPCHVPYTLPFVFSTADNMDGPREGG